MNQVESAAELLPQAIKTGIAGYHALEGKQKLQVLQNQKNPMYGAKPYGVQSYKKGGKIRKTGLAVVHKGEFVLPKKVVDAMGNKRKLRKHATEK